MIVDLMSFGYDHFSNKKPTNIFERAVALKKRLERVLVIDFYCQNQTKCRLLSVHFNRKELGSLPNFSNVTIFSSPDSYLVEMTWQKMLNRIKIKSKTLLKYKKYRKCS
ncbi:hypothetical protein PCC8801_3122 [Rippkaea orientalis PCC 8801]|uniref:Uncharacterized protein n=1 Tax=Rippkaea orientalis (strain PCC 8801 / RF-1) TaxID=41431 RepID=B7JXB5_RIPO1|nr:hypothetical protein PCC8801_3122 [Rippkaea orientalis PCC 8801]